MLEKQWEPLEYLCTKKSDKQKSFYSWFKKYHAEEMKKTLLYPIRVASGLGDPPSEFCTNDSEAISSSLKQFLGFKKSDWPVFNIRKFVSDQQEEVCKTLIGSGQYRLCEEYEHFAIAHSRWFTALTDCQKQDARKKFQQCSVEDVQPLPTKQGE